MQERGKTECDHPKHAERYDPRTGRVWCANCGETKRYEVKVKQ